MRDKINFKWAIGYISLLVHFSLVLFSYVVIQILNLFYWLDNLKATKFLSHSIPYYAYYVFINQEVCCLI
jgi:hypothetical protein